ncbi:Fe2+-dependent dioxygenase [Rhizorhabdus dicambivorans]|uniref:Fe2+-dependent dioxygenase n=1 Tax=Rhizorhabdus dicambivorans TaxID=1850238 RepID=A0A2A4FYS6_9SPHN|nr:Fe2+-dependent dioxygenase [Rhizorhabdus dicambivorans]ATE64073.1 Fe2+-dependent dioxygenase [Rhizorhabdus dicambivorans]PCE42654.1 Fe2+-dependent dioxygenase [Rhizorhabdus dicambivorans]
MMIAIPGVLAGRTLDHVRTLVTEAEWVDGNATSGHQSALAKRNRQLPEDSPAGREAGDIILDSLGATPLFIAAALPLKVFPPLFNRYGLEDRFDTHVDNAIRMKRGTDFRIRSDLSATLFLNDPDSYDGGELVVEDTLGTHQVKLAAGDMILYPASSLHHVTPITRGERLCSFFWIQSMVRDDGARRTLFDLDSAIQAVAADRGQADPAIIRLTGVYHNLLRRWADA